MAEEKNLIQEKEAELFRLLEQQEQLDIQRQELIRIIIQKRQELAKLREKKE